MLRDVKRRFRALEPKDRERIGIAMLKVNLGVNSVEERLLVEGFLSGLPLELRVGKLDPLLNYLHTGGNAAPPDFSGWYVRGDFNTNTNSQSGVSDHGLPGYNEDEVDTIKEPLKPFRDDGKID